VSKAIAEHLAGLQPQQNERRIDKHTEHAGSGIEVQMNGRFYRLGQLNYVRELSGSDWTIPVAYQNKTVTVFGDTEQVIACFVLEDKLRDEAISAIADLQSLGKEIILLSGDRQDVVADIAAQCHIREYRADLSPAQKHAYILDLQKQGAVVAMVGDGMNDGPALSLANVSIAMGQGAPISQTRSDCLLMSNRLSDLCFGIKLANQSYRLIRQNLAWALLYNLIAVPAAVLGYLEPWHAALGMSVSSLLVVLNGLRLLTMKPPDYDLHLLA
jgi:Cu2+-exporting ATPase